MRQICRSFISTAVVMAILAASTGCSTTSSHPTAEGTSDAVVFPKAGDAWPRAGTFPNSDNLRLLASGMTKDQLYALVGRPHFNEGAIGVREWDYLFNFKTGQLSPNDVLQCQMKVLFDQNMLTRTYFWTPQACAQFLVKRPPAAPAAPVAPVAVPTPTPTSAPVPVTRTTRLSADALFAFGRSGADALQREGREQIEALGKELASMRQVRRVEVVAYTDRLGADAYNQRLSQQRAEAVRGLLVAHGLDPQVVIAQGRGKADSVTSCGAMPRAQLIDCLAPDRRVEIRSMGVK